jgi:LacI family transcriptional regulator
MVTLKDIANACGVSTATVSYVVNGGPRAVLPATRERVQKAIDELGYQPNFAARSLMGKRTHTFGVVFPHEIAAPFDNEYFALVLTGIIDMATQRKQITMLFTGMSWDETERKLPLFCDGRCDGFVFVAPPPQSRLVQTLVERQAKCVVLGTRSAGSKLATIDSDNYEGARQATLRMIELGHRRIGMVYSNILSSSIPERIEGFEAALREKGIYPEFRPIWEVRHTEETSQAVTTRLLKSAEGSSLTAIICTQDSTALGVVQAAKELGLRVPEDLSVVGFDDLPFVQHSDPPITSVRQPLRTIGATAASVLFDMIEDPSYHPGEKLFAVNLIERESTAPPRVDE